MSHAALGPQFDEHVKAFGGKQYNDPACAESQCHAASSEFAKKVGGKVAYYTNPIKAARLPDWADPNDMTGEGEVGHVVVHHRGHAIDWTARQFWPDAPVPLIEPKTVYRKRFQRLDAVDKP